MAKTEIPDDFPITEEMRIWASLKVPSVDIDREHESFCDYWRAHGKKMADWEATWRMWMRRAPQMGGAMKPRASLAPILSLVESKKLHVGPREHPLFKGVK